MSTMSADSWQRTGTPSDRSYPSGRSPRADRLAPGSAGRRSGRPTPPHRTGDRDWAGDMRRADRRGSHDEPGAFSRDPGSRRIGEPGRAPRRPQDARSGARRPAEPRVAPSRAPRDASVAAPPQGSRLRGFLAVLAVFVLTLIGAGVDSVIGSGLGTITLAALAVSTGLAAFLVRRRDLLSVVVAPPLVFVAVAAVDLGAAHSAKISLPTIATLLIRSFPGMAIATVLAIVVALIRWAARR